MSATGVGVQLAIVAATVVGLWIGARLLVESVVRLARRVGFSELTIGLTVVAAGTSAPELVVTTDAAWRGFGDLAVGNVIGSNIYNLAFILGVVSLLRVVPVERSLVHRDGVVLIASTVLTGVALFDGTVSRVGGVGLVGLLVAYIAVLLRTGTESDASPSTADDPAIPTTVADAVGFRGRDAAFLIGGLAVVLVSGDLLVETAASLARGAGVSDWVIGGTIVAAGTSTPEFAVSLIAVRRGRLGVSVGNVVGSNVLNLLGVLGLAAAIRPLAVGGAARAAVGWLLVVSVVMVAALWTGRQLSRAEGGLFALSEVVRWVLGLLG
jgi:cation:H+ antiporter